MIFRYANAGTEMWAMFLLKMPRFQLSIGQNACECTAWIVVLFKTSCSKEGLFMHCILLKIRPTHLA